VKIQFKNPINKFAPVFLVLTGIFLLGFGCNTSKPASDPLVGWQGEVNEQPNQEILNDCQNYMQSLSPEERKYSGVSDWLKDGKGRHAFVIEEDFNGTTWNHVLIYNKDNKIIKTYKYVRGHYRN
jgi:hypothetical protein